MTLNKTRMQNLYVNYQPFAADGTIHAQGLHCLGALRPSSGAVPTHAASAHSGFQIKAQCLDGAPWARQAWWVDGSPGHAFTIESDGVMVTAVQTAGFLFAMVSLSDKDIAQQTRLAYQVLLKTIQRQNTPHLLRIWNFVPHINALESGIERYQLFNQGRKDAFADMGYTQADGAPAACALGTHDDALCIAVLAGKRPAIAIENPRQISAYHYPKQYGAQPPIFSRAALLPQAGGNDLLLISGTASIVGHQTLHPGDILAQVTESVRNIEAVLQRANQQVGTPVWQLDQLSGRVYLRHASDLGVVQAYLQSQGMTQFCFVEADICRSDLLVEIEGEGQCRPVRN